MYSINRVHLKYLYFAKYYILNIELYKIYLE